MDIDLALCNQLSLSPIAQLSYVVSYSLCNCRVGMQSVGGTGIGVLQLEHFASHDIDSHVCQVMSAWKSIMLELDADKEGEYPKTKILIWILKNVFNSLVIDI
jgi:hypothetical protein